MRADSLPAESQGKPKNTGGGSLSLLQQIFPIQELNQDLLHCKWVLYQLNYQGNPRMITVFLLFFFLADLFFSILFIYYFNFIFKLYIIVLVLPNIKMNLPQVYMCSPS